MLTLPIIDDTQYEIGYGIKVTVNNQTIRVGSGRFMTLEEISVPNNLKVIQYHTNQHGYSLVYIAVGKQLQQQGKSVCFVEDGINDSIALKKAEVTISLNRASSITADTAQIVLMDDNLQQFPKLFELSESL